MLKKRDAQGLSIRMIVLAVLALIVLIVVITIYSQENEKIIGSLKSCGAKGGTCESACGGGRIFYDIDCGDSSKVCCVNI